MDSKEFREAVYAVVAAIPEGKVTSYGAVARMAGFSGYARQVGFALAQLNEDSELPWHRVINAKGEVSRRSPWADNAGNELTQRILLEEEGVVFDKHGRIRISDYGWPE